LCQMSPRGATERHAGGGWTIGSQRNRHTQSTTRPRDSSRFIVVPRAIGSALKRVEVPDRWGGGWTPEPRQRRRSHAREWGSGGLEKAREVDMRWRATVNCIRGEGTRLEWSLWFTDLACLRGSHLVKLVQSLGAIRSPRGSGQRERDVGTTGTGQSTHPMTTIRSKRPTLSMSASDETTLRLGRAPTVRAPPRPGPEGSRRGPHVRHLRVASAKRTRARSMPAGENLRNIRCGNCHVLFGAHACNCHIRVDHVDLLLSHLRRPTAST